MDIFEKEFIGQILWFIALWISIFAFKEHDDRKILVYLALCPLFWGIHFSFLWLYAAAGINIFDVFKNIAGLIWKRSKIWTSIFVISYICIWIWVYLHTHTLISFLPTLAAVLGSIWVIYFSWYTMRFFLLLTLCIWLIYNIYGVSLPGITSDIILIFSTLYWIYTLERKNIWQ